MSASPEPIPVESNLDATIFAERVYVLYSNAVLGQAVNVVVAGAIGILAWDKVRPEIVLGWLAAALVVALARIVLSVSFRRAEPAAESIRPWYRRFFAGAIATGLLWSSAGILMFEPGSPAAQIVLMMILAGMAAGSVPVLAPAQEMYFAYCALTMLPISGMIGLQGNVDFQVVALLGIVFVVAMIVVAHRYHVSLTNALRLGFENEALTRQILAEKARTETQNVDLRDEVAVRRRTQAELQRERDAAETAARMRHEFLVGMSNEIRRPLNGIIGLANLALSDKLTRELREYFGRILALAQSLNGTISGVLDFSEIESGTLEIERTRTRLRDVLETVASNFNGLAGEKGVALEVFSDPGLPEYVTCDPMRIGQVLGNLLSNAIKFTDRGSITVDVRAVARAGNRLTTRFSVHDTGVGLSREQQRTVLSGSQRQTGEGGRLYGGAGLGLAVCRQLVTAMGGRIGVESEIGHGSRFWFELPLDVAGGEHPADSAVEAGAFDLGGLSVLIVDNDRVNQLIARTLLEKCGVAVSVAPDGRLAIKAALAPNTHFDAVLIDLYTPVIDTRSVVEALRAQFPPEALPIIAMTDRRAPGLAAEWLKRGVTAVLAKPLNPGELCRLLHKETRAGSREKGGR
jgi:signal transduction histidine kinase/ActR/RegA family two-component response regulator